MSEEKKLNGTVIVTYRCNARCSMQYLEGYHTKWMESV